MSPDNQTTQIELASGSRRWRFGCVGVCFVILLLGGGAGLGGYALFRNQVKKYTADLPVKLPAVDLTEKEMGRLKTKLETFAKTVEQAEPTEDLIELILSADEINAVINNDKRLRGKAFVKIEDGEFRGEVSVPADMLPGGEGRFLNARGTFDFQVIEGQLELILTDVEVKGETVSEALAETFSDELLKRLDKNPKNAAMVRRVQSVTVEDDKIILKLRREEESEAATPSAGEAVGG